jgi:hypothetical protein
VPHERSALQQDGVNGLEPDKRSLSASTGLAADRTHTAGRWQVLPTDRFERPNHRLAFSMSRDDRGR